MEKLIYINGVITFRNNDYQYEGFEIIDDNSFHLKLSGMDICLILNETELNGVTHKTIESFLKQLS